MLHNIISWSLPYIAIGCFLLSLLPGISMRWTWWLCVIGWVCILVYVIWFSKLQV